MPVLLSGITVTSYQCPWLVPTHPLETRLICIFIVFYCPDQAITKPCYDYAMKKLSMQVS